MEITIHMLIKPFFVLQNSFHDINGPYEKTKRVKVRTYIRDAARKISVEVSRVSRARRLISLISSSTTDGDVAWLCIPSTWKSS